MRYVVALALLSLVACQTSEEVAEVSEGEHAAEVTDFLDPVVVDSAHYVLEFENEYVRVLRENLAAGEEGAMHSHRDRVSVYLNDANVIITPQVGEPVDGRVLAGSTAWGDATTHKGIADADIENISIELGELTGAEIPLPEPDAVAVDPEHHVVEFENDRVRVVRMTYPPGFKTPLHGHRIGFGVFFTDAHGENVPEEGEPVKIEASARSTFWTTGQPAHVTENLGDEDLVVVLVEMKKEAHGAE